MLTIFQIFSTWFVTPPPCPAVAGVVLLLLLLLLLLLCFGQLSHLNGYGHTNIVEPYSNSRTHTEDNIAIESTTVSTERHTTRRTRTHGIENNVQTMST